MFRFLDDTMNVLLDFATPNRFVEAFVDDASNGLPFVACRAAFRFSRTFWTEDEVNRAVQEEAAMRSERMENLCGQEEHHLEMPVSQPTSPVSVCGDGTQILRNELQ